MWSRGCVIRRRQQPQKASSGRSSSMLPGMTNSQHCCRSAALCRPVSGFIGLIVACSFLHTQKVRYMVLLQQLCACQHYFSICVI